MKRKRVGLLGFDGVMALDLVGPIDAFTTAGIDQPDTKPGALYEVLIIGLNSGTFVSESGVTFKPDRTVQDAPLLDTLIIPGGAGLRDLKIQSQIADWVKSRVGKTRRIATVCTGTYGLAATGLLDGRRVTTHWRYARDLARQFPLVNVDANPLFVKDGPFYTCAGVTSGIDLSLALIEEDFGGEVALSVARELVVYLKRPGGQEQFSEPLKFQTESTNRFADLVPWMRGHLQKDLSVEALADRACLSVRHFNRQFKNVFGRSPSHFVEQIRLEEARQRLTMPNQNIESVAASVGFKSSDVFRRAFERRYGITPSSYRKRFNLRSI